MTALLTPIREIALEGRPSFTTTEDSFTDAGVKWMSDKFKSQFVGIAVPETFDKNFVVHNLESGSFDAPIISELGGVEKAESSISHFLSLLATNKGSSEFFILYLPGKGGNLWAVRGHWFMRDAGWFVGAHSTSIPSSWHAGSSVVSRKYLIS